MSSDELVNSHAIIIISIIIIITIELWSSEK